MNLTIIARPLSARLIIQLALINYLTADRKCFSPTFLVSPSSRLSQPASFQSNENQNFINFNNWFIRQSSRLPRSGPTTSRGKRNSVCKKSDERRGELFPRRRRQWNIHKLSFPLQVFGGDDERAKRKSKSPASTRGSEVIEIKSHLMPHKLDA